MPTDATLLAWPRWRGFTRYWRTPKGLVLVALAILLGAAIAGTGLSLVAPSLIAATGTAMLVDAPLLRLRDDVWSFPDGALISGLIVAMILSPHERWFVGAVTSAIGIISKHLARTRSANVFNPAALGVVLTYYLLDSGESWWGALPELPPASIILLLATGLFITVRVNKVPAVLAFLGAFFLLATLAAFVGDPARVAELYRAPDLHASLFLAFFMVTDPPTSPPKPRDQLVYGAMAGLTGYAVFALVGAVYFLLAGVLVANAWEAARRVRLARRRARRRAT